MDTTVFNTAVVVSALAKFDPAAPLLGDAIRYLVAHRGAGGSWSTSYEAAWTLIAMTDFIRGTGDLGADFRYGANLNGTPIAEALTGSPPLLTPVEVAVPLAELRGDASNELTIYRESGPGRLYYRANLLVERPVETVLPVRRGLAIHRSYLPSGLDCRESDCQPVGSGRIGDLVTVRLMLIVEEDAYYLVIEDHPPAGAEIVDLSLQTSPLGITTIDNVSSPNATPLWGWWFSNDPQIYSDRILWAADYLPAGTYYLDYTLSLNHLGDFRVLPAQASQVYFPEVQGASAGDIFRVLP
jgi:hypothetical protein